MNLLHVIDIFDPRYEYDQVMLTRKLGQLGHNVDILCSNYLLGDTKTHSGSEIISPLEIWRRPSIKFKPPGLKPIYLFNWSTLLSEYDIIHVYSLYTYSSLIAPLLKRRVKAKLVLRSEIGTFEDSTYHKTTTNPLYSVAFNYICKSAEAITAYTDTERNALLSLGINSNKIHVMPVGVNFKKFSEVSKSLEMNKLTIGFFGRFSPEKGVHRVIPLAKKIAHSLPNVHFVVAGFFEKCGYGELIINQLMKFQVKYLGCLDSNNNIDFYSQVDIVLVPSCSETGAIGVLEAMASGRIVIATNIYPINQYIANGQNGFLVSGENFANEAYTIICSILHDSILASQIASAARTKAKQFDWDQLVLNFEKLYSQLITEG